MGKITYVSDKKQSKDYFMREVCKEAMKGNNGLVSIDAYIKYQGCKSVDIQDKLTIMQLTKNKDIKNLLEDEVERLYKVEVC